MKKALCSIVVLIVGSVFFVSCGGYGSSSKTGSSGYKFRAFVSNPLHVSVTGQAIPVLEIIDAQADTGPFFNISLSGSSAFPGMLALSPNKQFTAVYSTTDHTVTTVNNANEAVQTTSSGSSGSAPLGSITLPGAAQNMVFWTDNNTLFVPVPTATSVFNPSTPGDVEVLNLGSAAISASVPVPGAQYETLSPDGNQLVVLGTSQNVVGVVIPLLIGTNTSPVKLITGFDKPVAAVFAGSSVYILDCGIECGGAGPASIIQQNLSDATADTAVPLVSGGVNGGATIALVSGSTMYVAGTPPGTTCPSGTAAITCGILSVVDLGTLTVTSTAIITDGYHDRMQMGANGQLFIGSNTCSNITTASETRGCLSIVNMSGSGGVSNSSVVFPPDNGDVTGIQPITNRNIVYVCEGAHFRIYDTTTDKLLVQNPIVDIIGQPTDVLLVDGPP